MSLHTNTLVKVNENNKLVESPDVSYTLDDVQNSLQNFGNDSDKIKIKDNERLVSLSELMILNPIEYIEVLVRVA